MCEEPDGNLYMNNEKSKELFQMIFKTVLIKSSFGFLDYSISNNTGNNSKKTTSQDHVNGLG